MNTDYFTLIVWACLMLVPIIPTFLLHKFLESFAIVNNLKNGFKLGGAIAAYFVLFVAGNYSYDNILKSRNTEKEIIVATASELVGQWVCNSRILEHSIPERIGILQTFKVSIYKDSKDVLQIQAIGDDGYRFYSEDSILTENSLLYFYKSDTTGSIGTVINQFVKEGDRIVELSGRWSVYNRVGRGTIDCMR